MSSSGLSVLVFHHLFAALCEEMGAALLRAAFSTNIKERRDFSCALFDADGRMVAQAAHLPVHLGSTPLSVRAAMALAPFAPGDTVVHNDPFDGGTHLPDITLVTPVFLGGTEPAFFLANRAHHADVGGTYPGSMGPAKEIHGEGLRIPPVLLVRGGTIDSALMGLMVANMRQPEERSGDLMAQWSANLVGGKRLESLAAEYGVMALGQRSAELIDWTARLAAGVIDDLAKRLAAAGGSVVFEDELEAERGRVPVIVELGMGPDGQQLVVDFTKVGDALAGPANAPRAVTVSAVFYCLRLLLAEGTPTNAGIMQRVRVVTRPGSLADAQYPAAVSAGNVEVSQRLVDVLLGALAVLLPEKLPSASAGTMSNLTLGSRAGAGFAHYETNAGGAGAGPMGHGQHGVQTHMTNTRNTPIETLETEQPVRVVAYSLRRGSGGAGAARGGDGLLRRIRFLVPAHLGWVAQRGRRGPFGLGGGGRGRTGGAWVIRDGVRQKLAGEASLEIEAGEEVEVQTPGGGGWGQKGV